MCELVTSASHNPRRKVALPFASKTEVLDQVLVVVDPHVVRNQSGKLGIRVPPPLDPPPWTFEEKACGEAL